MWKNKRSRSQSEKIIAKDQRYYLVLDGNGGGKEN